MKILVYNNDTNRMETYNRELSQRMPYNTNSTLTVREFRGVSESNILWTDRRCMQAWNSFRYLYGRGIFVGYGFRRSWEGGHGILSQHYAGVAFDVAQNLSTVQRNYMRNLAINSNIWNYVEPAEDTPRWVHFDERWTISGYPLSRKGSRGIYVCILQDGLTTLGYNTGGLDGVFGVKTETAVREYQARKNLGIDGIVGNITWRNLMTDVVGKGKTKTSIN